MTASKPKATVKETLAQLFETQFGNQPDFIEALPVSGSDREYYRLTDAKNTAIGTYNSNVNENNSYYYFTDLFLKHGVNVPVVYQRSKDKKHYLQQDLGNMSLFEKLMKEGLTPEVKACFQKALDELAKLQWGASTEANYDQCFATKKFDEKAIMQDLLYFKFYFADLQKIHYDKLGVLQEMEEWSRELGRIQPQVLMYRDFQSRNIMLHEGKTYLIDYQGAMQGPPHYDVASLLWQAKAHLPQEWKEELLRGYIAKLQEMPSARMDELHFRKGYMQFVLLRLLQVLGAYGFRGLLEKKPHFLSSIAPALKNLEQFLSDNPGLPAYPELRKLLENISSAPVQAIYDIPAVEKTESKLKIQINSFSYKNGYPEAPSEHGGGFVFDCRGILNPGRFEEYKTITGQDSSVQDFLMQKTAMPLFLEHAFALVSINVEDYLVRGFEHLAISFGCTGGQHRSVFAAEELAKFLVEKYGIEADVKHLNKAKWVLEKVSK